MFVLDLVKCGEVTMDIFVPQTVSLIVNLIKIGIPVLLIIFGMLDLGKAVMAQKEDEIKKSQQMFVKRLISAALVFFVVMIVQVVFNLVGGSNKEDNWSCVSCFINGPTKEAESDAQGVDNVKLAPDCRKAAE